MQLYKLVELRNELQKAVDLSVIHNELEKNSRNLKNLVSLCDEEYGQTITDIALQHSQVVEHLQADTLKIQETLDKINLDILDRSSKFFAENYQTELRYNDANVIRNVRVMHVPEEVDLLLQNRINLHSSWKYPALEIGCRDGEWTRYLVASDPLYVADVDQSFLDTSIAQFAPEYQKRVCRYLIQDFKIQNLPINQFGFIFSYNFFNYLSLDSIKQYLHQAWDWLKAGGSMIFTYNNADLPISASYAENYFMTYVPKSMLIPMCESMGFEVVASEDFLPSTSWIEIKKPGVLNTSKAHQTIGRIKYF